MIRPSPRKARGTVQMWGVEVHPPAWGWVFDMKSALLVMGTEAEANDYRTKQARAGNRIEKCRPVLVTYPAPSTTRRKRRRK